MTTHQKPSPQHPFSQELANALAEERLLRNASQKRAFTARVIQEITASPDSEILQGQTLNFWRRKRFLFGLAALLTLGLLSTFMMVSGWFSHSQHSYRMRVKAEKFPIPHKPGILQLPEVFAKEEGKNLVLLVYEHYGERCLWLYPEGELRDPRNDAEKAEWHRKEKWFERVNQGSLNLPEQALERSFPPHEPLVLMKIGNHYEIWTQAGLTRYFQKAGKPT